MEEEWRDIKDYEGLYQVSNLGRVKSLRGSYGNYREKILIFKESKEGYLRVGLHKLGTQKYYCIHRLVAEAFIPNPNNYPQVNHKDEDKSNNRVDNLEWCTREYNINYGTRNKRAGEHISKTHKSRGVSKGKNNPMYGKRHTGESKRKMSENKTYYSGSKHPQARKVQCITTGRKFDCIKEAGDYYLLDSYNHISSCCIGKRKYCGRHPVTEEILIWKYID